MPHRVRRHGGRLLRIWRWQVADMQVHLWVGNLYPSLAEVFDDGHQQLTLGEQAFLHLADIDTQFKFECIVGHFCEVDRRLRFA